MLHLQTTGAIFAPGQATSSSDEETDGDGALSESSACRDGSSDGEGSLAGPNGTAQGVGGQGVGSENFF